MSTIPTFSQFAQDGGKPAEANADAPEAETPDVENEKLPALFATIHHQSEQRPEGYSPDDIEELNNLANAHLKGGKEDTDERPQG
jgi:hypothetical protein